MPKRTDTRQRVLDTAAVLFQQQGYEATGLNQILTESGAPKGSLYFHFPGGKEQLATEALAMSGARLSRRLEDDLRQAATTAEAVDAIVNHLAERLVESDYAAGCPIATVALEATGNETIRRTCDDAYRSWERIIADHLASRGVPQENAGPLATTVLATIEGALLLAKTRKDLAPLRDAAAVLRPLLDPPSPQQA
ncbi:TetR/AcrR family transcriptional regulator [Thermostaphylospora chromogena]|uniref:Transcriptional regulator, TetR family n=1 Tax=Thermostaphylospora chromogena TaxID=35622 RepID=A0A1H1BIE9_9ACTN|nr:TetR/AcrR family transcriptional regulator [Thermostaphylospora chromogena]SDQ51643.1 transcriptional regulator, TetR family [Thermostaphylospora chromogena]